MIALSRLAIAAALIVGGVGCAKIPPGRSAIDDVRVRGAKTIDPDELGDKLATSKSDKFLGLFRGVVYDYEIYDPSVLQRDLARVERYYRGHGFFEAHARAGRVEQVSDDHVRIEIVVEEGPATTNRAIRIDGLDALPEEVRAGVIEAANESLEKGWRFNEDDYAAAKTKVQRALTDRGYAWAKVDADATIDVGARAVDYVFATEPGPRARLGAVTIVGLDPAGTREQEIEEAPLRRAMSLDPGETYSTEAIDTATQALLELEVFSAVEIEPALPDPPPADPVVPLTVKVEPTKLRQIRAGGGAEFDEIKTELHLVGGWEDHNFLGGLRNFTVAFQPGVVLFPTRLDNPVKPTNVLPEERLRLNLRQPAFVEQRTTGFIKPELNVFPFLVPKQPPDAPVVGYVEVKGSAGVDRPFGKLFVTLSYNAQTEVPFLYLGDNLTQLQTLVLSYPELLVWLDFRDDKNHPHEGFYLANDLQIAGGPFGGVATDVKVQPEARAYVPLGRRVTLATRGSVGFLLPHDYGDSITSLGQPDGKGGFAQGSVRDIEIMFFRGFFSGGPSSNRGFPVRGISPHGLVPFLNPQNASTLVAAGCDPAHPDSRCLLPVGGFTLWEASLEARIAISGPFSTAIFCDASDVSQKRDQIRFDRPHVACGVGARYDTPVGPIRLDIGYRVPPLQVIGKPDEYAAYLADPTEGLQPRILGQPLAIAFGIGEAY